MGVEEFVSPAPCEYLRAHDHPELDFTFCDELGNAVGLRSSRLRRDVLRDSQALEQLVQIKSAADLANVARVSCTSLPSWISASIGPAVLISR